MPTLQLRVAPLQNPERYAALAQAFAELQRQLGAGQPLAPASYVTVRELLATDWGYGGHTQAARRQAREATSATVGA